MKREDGKFGIKRAKKLSRDTLRQKIKLFSNALRRAQGKTRLALRNNLYQYRHLLKTRYPESA